jgi:hypothetical protein
MTRHLFLGLLAALVALAAARAAAPTDSIAKDIRSVVKQGKGSAAGRAAWDRLVAAGPSALPKILTALNTPDTVAANWLTTAFDRIVERSIREARGKGIDVPALLVFVKNAKNHGRARRLVLEVVDRLHPGTSTRLYPGWLNDPEFRFEAVRVAVQEAEALVAKNRKDQALGVYRKAFAAVRDLQQAKEVAVGLHRLGATHVSVAQHLGFLTDWYVIGPFDARKLKGFKTVYPPEQKIELRAEYQGKGKKVRWKRYQVREPPPSAKGPHVALVNLREALGGADDAVAFAYTEVTVVADRAVEFRGAADDNFTVWVNGKKEFAFEEYRNGVRLDRHRFRVQLKAGKNTVLVKVCQYLANAEPNWEFLLRMVDSTGKGVRFRSALPPMPKSKK